MSISRLVKILVAVFVILAGANIVFSMVASQANDRMDFAAEQRRVLSMAVQDLYRASEDLTRWARSYVVSRNPLELQAYWNEILVEQRQEGAVDIFEEYNAPQSERDLIQRALDLSVDLGIFEERAFEAAANNELDQLSGRPLAIGMLFGPEYEAGRLPIIQALDELNETVERRTLLYQEDAIAFASLFDTLSLASAFLSAVISVAGVLFILRKISPIRGLVQMVDDVANGRLNVNADRANISSDEIGSLTKNVFVLIDVIKGITNEIQVKSQRIVNGN